MTNPLAVPSLRVSILIVFSYRSKPKVVWIYAGWVIALVANAIIRWDITFVNLIGNPMRKICLFFT